MNEEQYNAACARYEQVKYATEGEEHEEKMRLVAEIQACEKALWDLPEPSEADIEALKRETK